MTAYGGLPLGEFYQSLAPFKADDRSTWGKGGKADLIIDPCTTGSTHRKSTAGSGYFKTSCLISSLCTWTGPAVILDPSKEIAAVITPVRERMRHRVRVLAQSTLADSYNALDWLDITLPTAEDDVLNVIEWVSGYTSRHDMTAQFFKDSGKTLLAAVLADLLWDDNANPALKTLLHFRAAISVSNEQIRARLKLIADTSLCEMARDFAIDLYDTVEETFSGIRRNAMEDTKWLSIPAHAALVSGDTFHTADILRGDTDVVISLPLDVLLNSPGVGRTIIGSFLNAAYRAEGRIWSSTLGPRGQRRRSRVYFGLDEAWALKSMGILATALFSGRKYGITIEMIYPADGLFIEQWGERRAQAIEAILSARSYAAILDWPTAEKVSKEIGEYTVLVESQSANSGWQGRWFNTNRSASQSRSVQETRRRLVTPEQILYDTPTDQQFVLGLGTYPWRGGRAIAWRRPEFAAILGQNPFLFEEEEDEPKDDEVSMLRQE